MLPDVELFIHPVVLGKDDGNFFKVLTAIYAKAEDSIKKGFIL